MSNAGKLFFLVGVLCLGNSVYAADSSNSESGNPVKQKLMEWTLTDQKFVDKAVASGRAEIELSQLAIQKSPTPRIKEFAQKMVDEHTKSSMDLKTLAQSKGLVIPLEMDSEHTKALKKLQTMEGANFDAYYIDRMIEDHEKNVSLFAAASSDKKLDSQLQTFAERLLPELKEHLTHAKALGKVDAH